MLCLSPQQRVSPDHRSDRADARVAARRLGRGQAGEAREGTRVVCVRHGADHWAHCRSAVDSCTGRPVPRADAQRTAAEAAHA